MYFNQPIFGRKKTKIEMMEETANVLIAQEVALTHTFKEEYTLRDKYFPYIESFLPKTEKILFKHIARYEDKNNEILNSPYLLKCLDFGNKESGEDYDIIFRCLNIDQEELRADIKKVPLPEMKNATEKAAFLPLQVALLLIIRYYMITKQPKKMEVVCYYYGYSIYWKRFNKSFSRGVYNVPAMKYTINNISYRNLIKKLGSLKALLLHIVKGRVEFYREGMSDCCDEDIRRILDQIQSDLGSKINSIASFYYKYAEEGKGIMNSDIMLDSVGAQRIDNSSMAAIEVLAQKYTHKFFMGKVSVARVKQAATMAKEVSVKELTNTVYYVLEKCTPEELADFYSSLFYIYVTLEDPRANAESIESILFLALMKGVITKGNSTEKNNVKVREYMDKWLEESSNTFRLSKRPATKTNYRKAVFYYFVLSVIQ